MENSIRFIIERLLGRNLSAEDGVSITMIQDTETRLSVKLPELLQTFYLCAGRNEDVMDVFQHFAPLDKLYVEDDKLVFLEENQGVCVWGISLAAPETVYQCPVPDKVWYAEDASLQAFLEICLYYQFAQGGYNYMASLYNDIDDAMITVVLQDLATHWEKVVDQPNNLIIYWSSDKLVWYFPDPQGGVGESLFLSCRTESEMQLMIDRYDFGEL
ncbi:hypothetical protein [Chitinophaga sp. HK235]|uniref:hypothetical protein n=1 Tax=Chitinophaga sp. HK235 TaxID=2952571 RepID=UPI001BA6332F|nr:hypothetical protein [Chitinophaga sp. HK235]